MVTKIKQQNWFLNWIKAILALGFCIAFIIVIIKFAVWFWKLW